MNWLQVGVLVHLGNSKARVLVLLLIKHRMHTFTTPNKENINFLSNYQNAAYFELADVLHLDTRHKAVK